MPQKHTTGWVKSGSGSVGSREWDAKQVAAQLGISASDAPPDALADKLVSRLESDLVVFSPRAGDPGGRAVSDWYDRNQDRFVALLTDILLESAGSPKLSHAVHASGITAPARDLAIEVLPLVKRKLRQYALQRAALRWGAGRYPNSVTFQAPERSGDYWCIALIHAASARQVGQIVLDDEGNVVASDTTTRQEARERLLSAA